jgi:hypothetical protein
VIFLTTGNSETSQQIEVDVASGTAVAVMFDFGGLCELAVAASLFQMHFKLLFIAVT